MALDAHKSAVAKAYGLAGVSANCLHGFERVKAHCRMALSYSMLFPTQHRPDDPLHKAHPAGPGKHYGKRPQKRLPPLPQFCSFVHDTPLLLPGNHSGHHNQKGCLRGSVLATQNLRNDCSGRLLLIGGAVGGFLGAWVRQWDIADSNG
jgi:hypothetical protein